MGQGQVIRLNMRFTGRVQGVGFRAAVARLAHSRLVVGRVCNLSDGSVELLAEGEREDLSEFRHSVLRELDRFIVDFSEDWTDASQNWSEFAIDRDKLV